MRMGDDESVPFRSERRCRCGEILKATHLVECKEWELTDEERELKEKIIELINKNGGKVWYAKWMEEDEERARWDWRELVRNTFSLSARNRDEILLERCVFVGFSSTECLRATKKMGIDEKASSEYGDTLRRLVFGMICKKYEKVMEYLME